MRVGRSWPWAVLLVAGAMALWHLGVGTGLPGGGDAAPEDAAERSPEPRTAEGPVLEGQPAPPDVPTTTFTLRVVNARGQPLAYAWVRLRTHGARSRVVRAQADETGLVSVELEGERVASVEVEVRGSSRPVRIASWSEGRTPEELAKVLHVAEGLDLVVGFTQDVEGARREMRVVFRVLDPAGGAPGVWLMDRSDAWGRFILGPFPTEVEVEVGLGAFVVAPDLPKPLGLVARTRPGAEPLELTIPRPTLRVSVPGVAKDAEVPVGRLLTFLNGWGGGGSSLRRLNGGVFEVEGVIPHHGIDLIVGPLADGRYGVLRGMQAEAEPVEIELVAGKAVRGQATAPEGTDRFDGHALLEGDGWAQRLPLEAGGWFGAPGVPPGQVRVWVEARDADSGATLVGVFRGSHDGRLLVPLRPGFVLAGRVRLDEVDPPRIRRPRLLLGTPLEWRVLPLGTDGRFRAVVPGGETELILAADPAEGSEEWRGLWSSRIDRDHDELDLPQRR
jgi:hypothetical protein